MKVNTSCSNMTAGNLTGGNGRQCGGSMGAFPGFAIDPLVIYTSCTINALISFLSIAGNTLVLAAFFKTVKLRNYQTYYLIASLAVADFVVGCFTLPLWTYMILDRFRQYNNGIFYFVYQTFDVFSTAGSIIHLMFISLERYFAIVWPVVHHLATSSTYGVVMAIIWIISVVASCVTVRATQIYRENYVTFNSIFLFGIPLIVIVFSYLGVLRATLKRSQSSSSKAFKKELKVTMTIFILVALFIISWCPFFINTIIASQCPKRAPPCITLTTVIFLKCISFSSSFCNPFVYAARVPEFKKAFKKLLPTKLFKIIFCHAKSEEESPPSSRCRTASAMSASMMEVSEHRMKELRLRPILVDNKSISRHIAPACNSIGSTSVSVSPDRVNFLEGSPSPLSGLNLTSV